MGGRTNRPPFDEIMQGLAFRLSAQLRRSDDYDWRITVVHLPYLGLQDDSGASGTRVNLLEQLLRTEPQIEVSTPLPVTRSGSWTQRSLITDAIIAVNFETFKACCLYGRDASVGLLVPAEIS